MRKDEFPIVDKVVKDSINEVLDKIRAEISNDMHRCNNTDMAFGMQHTLDIIDKYRGVNE